MAERTIGNVLKDVGQGIFNRTLGRLTGAGISTDSRIVNARAKWSGRSDKRDWRVRLQIPTGADALYEALMAKNDLLAPLRDARGIFWPLTPAVVIQHSANYNPLSQTHLQNWCFPSRGNLLHPLQRPFEPELQSPGKPKKPNLRGP